MVRSLQAAINTSLLSLSGLAGQQKALNRGLLQWTSINCKLIPPIAWGKTVLEKHQSTGLSRQESHSGWFGQLLDLTSCWLFSRHSGGREGWFRFIPHPRTEPTLPHFQPGSGSDLPGSEVQEPGLPWWKYRPTHSSTPKPLVADSQGSPCSWLILSLSFPCDTSLSGDRKQSMDPWWSFWGPRQLTGAMTSWADWDPILFPLSLLLLNFQHCEMSGPNVVVGDLLMPRRRTDHFQCSS